jgi:K+-transporting ATPase ATPase A chain
MDFLQIGVVLALVMILAIPMAKYLSNVYSLEITKQDRIFGRKNAVFINFLVSKQVI